MMSTEHPITPPPELIDQWFNEWYWYDSKPPGGPLQYTATQAARWGADQELEACVAWLRQNVGRWEIPEELRDARRPKPPSLKEQALATLEAMEKLWESCGDNPTDIIRCALEALPDD